MSLQLLWNTCSSYSNHLHYKTLIHKSTAFIMNLSSRAIATIALLGASGGVTGFGVKPPSYGLLHGSRTASTCLFGIRCEDKYYQLEEMEDKDNATTELFLKVDGTVQFGDTDGPRWISAKGEWSVTPGTDDFTMKISREFKAGVDNTDMGEFEYELERIYVGDMTMVGACVAITGVMRIPELSGREVGFFNMIDATNVRDGNDDGKIVE